MSYVLSTQEKLRAAKDLIQENLAKAQEKQKTWYDKNARLRQFEPGDPVLVLLPTSTSKLLAQWQGPYQVMKRTGKVNCLVDMQDGQKRKRVFHVNMLRAFKVHQTTDSNYLADNADDDDDDEIIFWRDGDPEEQPTVGDQLSKQQQEELNQLLTDSRAVFQNRPGHTQLGEHEIITGTAKPIRLPPYRLPQAYRSQVQKELQEMQDEGIIEPSSSEWAAPIIPVSEVEPYLTYRCVPHA